MPSADAVIGSAQENRLITMGFSYDTTGSTAFYTYPPNPPRTFPGFGELTDWQWRVWRDLVRAASAWKQVPPEKANQAAEDVKQTILNAIDVAKTVTGLHPLIRGFLIDIFLTLEGCPPGSTADSILGFILAEAAATSAERNSVGSARAYQALRIFMANQSLVAGITNPMQKEIAQTKLAQMSLAYAEASTDIVTPTTYSRTASQTPAAPEERALPSYLIPALAVGGGSLLLLVLVLKFRKKKSGE